MLSFIQATWADLRAFLAAPYDRMDAEASTGFRWRRTLAVLAIDLVVSLVMLLVISGISELGIVDLENHAVAEGFANMPVAVILLVAVLVGPLIEELIFRLPLRFQTNPFMLVAGLFRRSTPGAAIPTEVSVDAPPPPSPLRRWWDRNYRWIFYLTAAAFAYIHLANFEVTTAVLLLSPILVAAQFWVGLLAGYLRVRYGFVWSYVLHALHNLLLVGGALLADGPTERIAVDNDDYFLRLEEVSAFGQELDYATYQGEDSLAYVNYQLSETIASLLQDRYSVVDFPEAEANPRINLYFGDRKSGTDDRAFILAEIGKEYEFTVKTDPTDSAKATLVFE